MIGLMVVKVMVQPRPQHIFCYNRKTKNWSGDEGGWWLSFRCGEFVLV